MKASVWETPRQWTMLGCQKSPCAEMLEDKCLKSSETLQSFQRSRVSLCPYVDLVPGGRPAGTASTNLYKLDHPWRPGGRVWPNFPSWVELHSALSLRTVLCRGRLTGSNKKNPNFVLLDSKNWIQSNWRIVKNLQTKHKFQFLFSVMIISFI